MNRPEILNKPNHVALTLADLLTWSLIEFKKSGRPSQQLIASLVLEKTNDHPLDQPIDERSAGDEDGQG